MRQAELINEIEKQKHEQEAWNLALDKLKQAKEDQAKKHAERIAALQAFKADTADDTNPQLAWIKNRLAETKGAPPEATEVEARAQQIEKTKKSLQDILDQQQQLAEKAAQLSKEPALLITPDIQALLNATKTNTPKAEENTIDQEALAQSTLMEQLKASLLSKNKTPPGDWQKEALRQFLVNSNKAQGAGGATILKPELLRRLTNEPEEFSMPEWLATLNKEESGEWTCDDFDECKHKKVKSGMLDRATANIFHKEVWPQRNLLEDWADKDIEFKHLQFEHHIAGEVRTIETCTEPAQILGRLRLLRRMAYAKLRGYDWPVIRKMYAAIVRSIEAKEYTWSDNFDRFETILYRRPATAPRSNYRAEPVRDKDQQKKWFCRDWNRQEGCSKQAPHRAWFGSGSNAVPRTVQHICAACYMKERAARDHPETSEACPHKTA